MLTNKTPWIVLLLLWMIGSTWWHVCKIKQLCGNVPQSVAAPTNLSPDSLSASAEGYSIADGDLFRLDLPGNFSFAKSGANANMNTLGGSLETMIAYLKANPGRSLEIIGYYSPSESNSTTFPNLGLARAEGIRQYLVQQGIPAASLTTKSVEQDLLFQAAKGDSLYGGLDFAFSGAEPAVSTDTTTAPAVVKLTEPTTEKALAEAEKFTSVFKPIDLYFPLAQANYLQTDETKKFFAEAAAYLAGHKDKKLVLTGHTDNSGPDAVNMQLSRDRANDVKAKLRKTGIEASQIDVRAKGETEPKADNNTISGRKANRRVTVVVE
ncbi:OmpA family protein [Spirosoma fluviale]|uniref:OmpA-OmpF porin, OOP family n=1 Tax=Spirosoma fluviale TaxID=1597977 RepID=A0A286FDW2_9BACT|nr:OmpA family protein [Spirosoma fluviale]SOD81408.1 OmpA-OmpF porin, OOP family [Spirosoma fluviale]